MYSARDAAKAAGFPIRKSADQSLLTAPRGLSQRATSFIASRRQGIHQMPLKRLKEPSSMRADGLSAAQNDGSHDQHKKNYHVLCIIRSRPANRLGKKNLAGRRSRRKKPLHNLKERDNLRRNQSSGKPEQEHFRRPQRKHERRRQQTMGNTKPRRPPIDRNQTNSRMVEPDGIEPTT